VPRLSLYKPEKGNDYYFIDRQANEMFTLGGTDVYLHKYLGANTSAENATADQPNYVSNQVANIQDLLFLENRDGTYDTTIYKLRGIYNVQNIDFNISQFGLFIDNDTLYMTVHINNFIRLVGRKPISGDVIELPHLRENFALNDLSIGLPRYYVIEDVGRASEGFSVTWYPHLYRLKIKKIVDSQKFASIFNQTALDANGDPTNLTLRDLLSTYNKELSINNQVVAQAEADAPKSGYETRQYYTLAVDPATGKPLLETTDTDNVLASDTSERASGVNAVPQRSGYTGYLLGDGFPVNGYEFGFGIQFPENPVNNDFFLRVDMLPNRLYRYESSGSIWVAVEDSVRMTMTQTDTRATQKTGFINNDNYTYFDAVTADYVTLAQGATTVPTIIPPGTVGLYLVLKYEVAMLQFVVADNPNLLTTYQYVNPAGMTSTMTQINLPVTNGVQTTIPYAGQWTVTFYNDRINERQSLSKALKPRADL